jgi:flagellar hook-associated protein 3 FlgL
MPTPVTVNSRTPLTIQADRMTALDRQISRLGSQISTGERFSTPSEDPVAAARASLLVRLDERLQADDRSLARADSRLALAESAVVTAREALLRARELALLGANGTLAPEDRAAIGREVAVLGDQLFDSANARDESGRSLFAGAANGLPAYVRDADGQVVWQGIDAAAGSEAAGVAGTAPLPGPRLFGSGPASAFAAISQLGAALSQPDPGLREPAFADALALLETATNRLLDGQSSLGAAMARIASEQERVAAARLQTADALAGAQGLDLTAAIAQLDALKTTLQAAQGAFVRIYEGTLFDRLG